MKADGIFGIHEQALKLHDRRTEVLAANLANADTPGYKARDFDFQATLRDAQSRQVPGSVAMKITNLRHIAVAPMPSPLEMLQYRVPDQPSVDGNTVDSQREQAAFAENEVGHQATIRFIDGALGTLKRAIKGQ